MQELHHKEDQEDPEVIARLNALYEWILDQVNRPDFEWPDDLDPEDYKHRSD